MEEDRLAQLIDMVGNLRTTMLDDHDNRFTAIEKKLAKLDAHFAAIEKKLDKIEENLQEHDRCFDEHDLRFEHLEGKKDKILKSFDVLAMM